MQYGTPGRSTCQWASRCRDSLPARPPHCRASYHHEAPGTNQLYCYTGWSAPNWSSFHTSPSTTPKRFRTYRRSPARWEPSSRLPESCSLNCLCTRRRHQRYCFQHTCNPCSCYPLWRRIPIPLLLAAFIRPPQMDLSLSFRLCPTGFRCCHRL